MATANLRMVIPDYVIEKAVDDYLSNIFGREVVWDDYGGVIEYRVSVDEYFHPPHKINFEEFEVEHEWDYY